MGRRSDLVNHHQARRDELGDVRPGSEAVHPTYWLPFNNDMTNRERVGKVLEWLRLPEAERPSFLTLYFGDVDSAGHRHGPDAPETAAAVARVDAELGALVQGLTSLGLLDRTTIVATSDHGMIETSSERMST